MNQSIVPDAQARAGDLEGALLTTKAIADSSAKEAALRYIAEHWQIRVTPKAIEIAGILSANERVLSLHDVSEAQADTGDRVGALATLRVATAIDVALVGEMLRTWPDRCAD